MANTTDTSLKTGVSDVILKKGVAKTGNPYTMLIVKFDNGLDISVLLDKVQQFAVDTVDTAENIKVNNES